MEMTNNIKSLWKEQCLKRTKELIIETIAKDGRFVPSTLLSVRQRYFYDYNINEEEAPMILDIVHNALRAQNRAINKAISK